MITAIREGGITWLLPQVGHLAHAEEGPLITWVGAISIWIFGPFIGDITAGRLPNLLWFGITASSVWYGTYLLGRRSEAQPLALPFGGEPPPRDYGRMLADAALLLLLATVGILQRTHETTVIPAIMACQALAFYSLARSIDRPLTGATTLAIALAASFLTRGWIGAIPIGRRAADLLSAQPIVAPQALAALDRPVDRGADHGVVDPRHAGQRILDPQLEDLEPVLLRRPRPARHGPHAARPALVSVARLAARPAGCLALARVDLRAAYLGAADAVDQLGLLLFGLAEPSDSEYALLAVPCAVLAAFSLPTLRRGVVNTLDWFAVMCFR